MEIVNTTPLHLAWMIGKKEPPQDSLTFFAKATFDLVPNEKAVLSSEQEFMTGDQHAGDDISKTLLYESDFCLYKPNTDLLCIASCHTPEAKPLNSCKVKFTVAGIGKELIVHGPHYVTPSMLGGSTYSTPEQFTTLPISYENAYGGTGYHKNPMGKGKHADEKGVTWAPNIEDPATSKTEAMSFGPINRAWPQRNQKMGTYNSDWQENRWPWFPEDFDWSHFNAAPEDMQANGYLVGNESMHFENLHPVHSKFFAHLPGILPRCFVHEPDGDEKFREVSMNLDTIWVNVETEKLVLVWRGLIDVKSQDYSELSHVYLGSEEMEAASKSADEHKELFENIIAPPIAIAAVATLPETPIVADEPIENEPDKSNEEEEIDPKVAEALEQVKNELQKAGADPSLVDDLLNAEDPALVLAAFFETLGLDSEAGEAAVKESQEKMKEAFAEQGLTDEEIEHLLGEGR